MPEMVMHRFGIDIYLGREFQGTSYIDIEIYRDDAEIISLCSGKGERLPAQSVLADVYALVLQKAYEQEEENCHNHEYPYEEINDFEECSLKIFV